MPPSRDTIYETGTVYKLSCHQNPYYYWGSTCGSLRLRKSRHIAHSKTRESPVARWIKEIGKGNIIIEPIQTLPNISKGDLEMRETEQIRQSLQDPNCLNCRSSYCTREERLAQRNKWQKIYYQQHKSEKKEYDTEYRKHTEEKNRKGGEWNRIVVCEVCGSQMSSRKYPRHTRTNRHINASSSSSQEEPHSSPSPHP